MHSLELERIPSQLISSRTIVSFTRCLVKKRLVDVAPIMLFLSYCYCYYAAELTVLSAPGPAKLPRELLATDVLRWLSPVLITLPPNIGS